jgi:hypothetical protein
MLLDRLIENRHQVVQALGIMQVWIAKSRDAERELSEFVGVWLVCHQIIPYLFA